MGDTAAGGRRRRRDGPARRRERGKRPTAPSYVKRQIPFFPIADEEARGRREDQADGAAGIDSLEAPITFVWDWFLFDDPELDWSTTLQAIPSLTESGRIRGEINTALKWEIVGDLNWVLSFYGSFDNQAQDGQDGAESSDFGVNTSFVYEF